MDMAYVWYEAAHFLMTPARAVSDVTHSLFSNPANPLSKTPYGRTVAAACELFERTTRRYGKPEFGFETTQIDGEDFSIHEKIVWQDTFCNVIHFARHPMARMKAQPKLLIVAPMSGHYATLLRGTVEAFLPSHEVYITDWVDARLVPLSKGRFDLDDYIDYVKAICRALGPDIHMIAVCQPSVPVIAAVARMEAENDPMTPRSITLMGGTD
jgi:poly(3-hydroxybutyrate) depolymerase